MSTKKFSNMQEKRIAKKLGGKTQPASGALPIASLKSDVKVTNSEDWKVLISAKTYGKTIAKKVLHLKEWLEEVKT